MALNPREQITDTSPQSLNKLNNNFMTIWKTLFGGLDFSDTNNELKKKIQTQQIPVQGEGNFDKNFPLYIRFFVPNNTKSITSTSFNMICERYRMDSSVAMDGGGKVGVDINMSLATANTAVASVSSPTVGVTSVSSASTSASITTPVSSWYRYHPGGNKGDNKNPPLRPIQGTLSGDLYTSLTATDYATGTSVDGYDLLGVIVRSGPSNHGSVNYIDLNYLNHEHEVTITTQPHSHSISLSPHSHEIELAPHTHEATASVDLPDHGHNLNEGIKVSTQEALNVEVKLNGTKIADLDSMSGSIKNNIDAKDLIKIGEWNILECTTTSLARITIYGIIELIKQY